MQDHTDAAAGGTPRYSMVLARVRCVDSRERPPRPMGRLAEYPTAAQYPVSFVELVTPTPLAVSRTLMPNLGRTVAAVVRDQETKTMRPAARRDGAARQPVPP